MAIEFSPLIIHTHTENLILDIPNNLATLHCRMQKHTSVITTLNKRTKYPQNYVTCFIVKAHIKDWLIENGSGVVNVTFTMTTATLNLVKGVTKINSWPINYTMNDQGQTCQGYIQTSGKSVQYRVV